LSDLRSVSLRPPKLEDGMAAFQLVENCPPLDINSSYCNLLQCSHFANTSVMAEKNGTLLGFISGYAIPERPDTLFIWQVAVAAQARGLGLASRMLAHILARPHCTDITYLETTITQDNHASWALFNRLTSTLSAKLQSSAWMDKDTHFTGQHDSEALVRIGPFNAHGQSNERETT
jgi:L-2,4-diaminobutyric acid acetyltransferase